MRAACTIALLGLLATAVPSAEEPVVVELEAASPEPGVQIGYGAARRLAVETTVPRFLLEIPSLRAKDGLFARLTLGGAEGVPVYVALDRSEGGTHHDRLYVDRNRDLDLTNDGEPLKAELHTTARGDKLVEFPAVDLSLSYSIEGVAAKESYRGVVFYEGSGDRAPGVLYFERDGWREGVVAIEGVDYRVAILDDDSDGIYSTSDSWTVRRADEPRAGMLADGRPRAIGFPCWIADQKRTVEVATIDRAGRSATLRAAEAKETEREYFLRVRAKSLTPEERELQIDPFRPRVRPDQNLTWIEGKEIQYSLDVGDKVKKRILIEFTAPDCVWCDRMQRLTFRDREVYDLCRQLVCGRIAYTAGAGDSARYGVQGTPTYLVLDASGKELARQTGFANPTVFAEFLKKALR